MGTPRPGLIDKTDTILTPFLRLFTNAPLEDEGQKEKMLYEKNSSPPLRDSWTRGLSRKTSLLALLLPIGLNAGAQDFEADGLGYSFLTGSTVKVTGHLIDGSYASGNVVIPESVVYEGMTYAVTSVGSFSKCPITSVVIPNSVASISYGAFKQTELTSVFIPKSVVDFDGAFNKCSTLQEITIDPGNQYFTSIDGVAYTKDVDTLYYCPEGKLSITILESVTTIGQCSFAYCNIPFIHIPNTVTAIETEAFVCGNLTSVVIGNSVATIGHYVFDQCDNLTTVVIGSSVTSIGQYVFGWNSSSLKEIYCKAQTPPAYTENSYVANEIFKNATLYVPVGTKAAYEATDSWQRFQNIKEMDEEGFLEVEEGLIITGIAGVAVSDGGVAVRAEDGTIFIDGMADSAAVEVYSTGGQLVYQGRETRIGNLGTGVYIVRVGDSVQKVVLR